MSRTDEKEKARTFSRYRLIFVEKWEKEGGSMRRIPIEEVGIHTESIKLDSFLKLCSLALSGGEAKELIQSGAVRVNKEQELRRGRKLVPGDRIALLGRLFLVKEEELPEE